MQNATETRSPRHYFTLGVAAGLVLPYALVLAILEGTAYWYRFGVSFLEYVSIDQVATAATASLLWRSIIGFGIAMSLAILLPVEWIRFVISERNSQQPKYSLGLIVRLVVALVIVVLAVVTQFSPMNLLKSWMHLEIVGAIVLSLAAAYGLIRVGLFKEFEDPRVRFAAIVVLTLLPASAWIGGRMDAQNLAYGGKYARVVHTKSLDELLPEHIGQDLRIIGHLERWTFILACKNPSPCERDSSSILRVSDEALTLLTVRVANSNKPPVSTRIPPSQFDP